MKRIFIKNLENTQIKIDQENQNYLIKILRIKHPCEIIVFNGEKEYNAIFNPKSLTIEIKNFIRTKETNNIKLAIGEIKKQRLEWLIEKATELGVNEIYILKTDRSQKHNNNISRLNKITISACQQCNRISIPKIEYKSLDDFLQEINYSEWMVASINTNTTNNTNKKGVIIGPEGGWSKKEEDLFHKYKLSLIKLNNLILRSETAAITGTHQIIMNTK